MWVEFVVGSRPCCEGFSPGTLYSGFPPSTKTNISKFQFDLETAERRATPWIPLKFHYYYYSSVNICMLMKLKRHYRALWHNLKDVVIIIIIIIIIIIMYSVCTVCTAWNKCPAGHFFLSKKYSNCLLAYSELKYKCKCPGQLFKDCNTLYTVDCKKPVTIQVEGINQELYDKTASWEALHPQVHVSAYMH